MINQPVAVKGQNMRSQKMLLSGAPIAFDEIVMVPVPNQGFPEIKKKRKNKM